MVPQEVYISDKTGDTCFTWCGEQIRELTEYKLKASLVETLELRYTTDMANFREVIVVSKEETILLRKDIEVKEEDLATVKQRLVIEQRKTKRVAIAAGVIIILTSIKWQ